VQSREECRLGVGYGFWHGRDPQGALPESLEPETEGLKFYLEVPRLWCEVFWQPRDDGAG